MAKKFKPAVLEAVLGPESMAPVKTEQPKQKRFKLSALESAFDTDYLDMLSATGQMDAENKAAYDAKRKSEGEDPTLNYTAKAAEKLAQQKQKEMDSYKASDEYKKTPPKIQTSGTGDFAADAGAYIGSILSNLFQTGNWEGNEKAGQLRAEVDYLQRIADNAKNQGVILEDMASYEKWPEEDKKDLERYLKYTGRGTATGALPALLSGATAAKDRLVKKYGRETVRNILESMSWKLGAEDEVATTKAGQENASPLESLLSVPLGIVGGATAASDYLGQILKDVTGVSSGRFSGINPNTPGAMPMIYSEAVRQKESENVKDWAQATAEIHGADEKTQKAVGAVASTVYTAGMGALDNLTRVYATGGVGALALAATGSFSSAVRQATLNGASAQQAAAFGFVSAAIEVLTEKLPLDNLLDNLASAGSGAGILSILTGAAKQAGIELTTEELNLVAGIAAEALILRENSDYRKGIAEMVAQGTPYNEAVKAANSNLIQQAGQTALQSGLSGFMTSAGTSAVTQQGSANRFTEAAQQYESDKQSAYDRAQELLTIAKGKTTQTQNGTASQQATQTGKLDVNELVDEVIAKNTGAPADPVGAAVESFRQTGTVSNKQATDILNSVKAVQQLVQKTGVKLDGLTMSQRRNAVKTAIEQMAQEQVSTESTSSTETIESNGIKEQLRSQQDTLNNMQPAVEIQAPAEFSGMDKAGKQNWVVEKLRPTGYKVDRKGFGIIDFAKKRLKAAFKYFDSGSAEEASFEAIPYVLESGIEISSHADHKGRNYRTVTIAAPVVVNGKRGNMAVVVKQTDGNHYKVHRILTPDGSVFQLSETTNEADRADGGVTETGSLATSNGAASSETGVFGNSEAGHRQTQTLIPDSNTIIPNDSETVNTENGDGVNDVNYNTRAIDRSSTSRPANADTVDISRPAIAPNPTIAPEAQKVNTENGAVGAAEKGFSPKYELIDNYGAIPEGENPVRVDQLPKSTTGDDRVSYSARTAMEAKVTPDEFVPLIEAETMKGGFSFIPLKNTDVVQEAEAVITKAGWDDAKVDWAAAVRAGKNSPQLTAIGALLYNNAVNSGDFEAALDILSDYQLSVRNSAQALQAARILKTLTPENRLYMIQKSVDQMVEDMHLDTEITIDEDLQDEYVNAETEEERDAVIEKIQQHVADQIPSTFMEKWTALRYVNMLGNLRTQVRNVTGNLGMKAVSSAKNAVAATIENIAHKASGGKFRRTKSLTVSKELLNAARSDFSEVESMILGGGKYSDSRSESTEFARGVKDKQTVFKLKPLEGYRKLTNWAMEQGDLVFSRSAYARALAGYLKANGVTGSDLSSVDTALLDEARLYAVQEAQEQTFRDTNWLSGWVSTIGRRKDTPGAVKAISEGVMPFRKTPANVLIRAEEYSPLGVINSVVTSINALRKGSDVTGTQVVNSWAKSLTGTGIFGLGMLLQSLGMLSAGPDEDEDKDSFDSMNGWQNYALTLPDGTNLTVDFLTPSAIPLLMGAELMQLMQDGNISVKDIESALTSLADPMVEMSMLQGVNDTLENVRYAENNLGQMVVNSALSYLTQGLTNTLAGQLERTFEPSRMQTYVDKDSDLPDWLQRTLGKASAKTPGLDFSQIPYINAWGEEEENPNVGLNGLYNLLSPSYIEKGVSTELTQELNRLNSAQSDVNVYPSTPDKTVTFSGQDYNLSADEYVSLAKLQGQTQKQLVEDLISHEVYASLSDGDKAKAIRYAYDYARDSARGDVVPDHPGITTKWMAELEGDIAEGILRKISAGTTEKYMSLSIEKASFVTELLDSILPPAGKNGATQQQKVQAVTSADSRLSDKEQQQVLKEVLSESAYGKYLEILALGYSNDDYSDSYRIYTTEKDIGGKGTKARTVEAFRKEFGISESAATALYEIYNPK